MITMISDNKHLDLPNTIEPAKPLRTVYLDTQIVKRFILVSLFFV